MEDLFSQREDADFIRVAKVYRSGKSILCVHQLYEAFDYIIHVAETPCLCSIPINSKVFAPEGLNNKVADDPAVVRVHPRSIYIENTPDFYPDFMLPEIVEKKRLSTSFALIVAGAKSDGVHISPIAF